MKEKKLVPKRRFKEFQNTDAWRQRKLGELCDKFQSGKNIKSEDILDEGRYPVFGGNGFRGYTNTYNHKGLYALIGRQGALCGNMNISDGKAYFTEHAVSVKGNKNNETRFLFYLLGKMNLGQYSGQSAQPGLAVNKLIELTAFIPTFAEQTQISVLLKKLDNTIALHQRKLDKTKALKSAYLAEMFPAEGERVPKRRFAGFIGEWEHRKFDEEIELYGGLTYSPKDIKEKGTFVLRSSNVKNGEIVDADNVYVNSEVVNSSNVRKGDIIVVVRNGSRSLIGKHAQIKVKMCGTVIGAFMTGIRSCQPGFINALLDTKEFKKEIDKNLGATINQITNGMFRKMIFLFPEIQEQQAIGEFFKKLDDTITNQQQKLNKLKAMKQAYLQEMFV